MAYTSTSGKKFGSAFAGRKKDEMDSQKEGGDPKNNPFGSSKSVAEKAPAPPAPPMGGAPKLPMAGAKPAASPPQEPTEGGMHQDPKNVVAAHGKASSVHITHDHAANKHSVTSTHPDGHVHHSEHASAQEANEAGSQLGGAGNSEPEGQEQAEGGAPESDGFNMPSLG